MTKANAATQSKKPQRDLRSDGEGYHMSMSSNPAKIVFSLDPRGLQMTNSRTASDPDMAHQNLTVAFNLASLELPVFPCLAKPKGNKKAKAPHTSQGFYDATTSQEQIKAWWEKWPDALVGVPTGAITGFSVLDGDIDRETGKPVGEEEIVEIGLSHPEAVKIRTPSGGVQLIFSHVAGAKTSSKQVASHIDTRGDGGYIVAPECIMPNGSQYIYEGRRLAEALNANDLPPYPLVKVEQATAREKERKKTAKHADNTTLNSASISDFGKARATDTETLEATRAALAIAPNVLIREDWVKLAASLRAGFGHTLREDFIAFSCRYTKGDCTTAEAEHVWNSTVPNTVTTIAPALALLKAEMDEAAWKALWRQVLSSRDHSKQVAQIGTTNAAEPAIRLVLKDDPVDLWDNFDPPKLPEGLLPPLIEQFALLNGKQMGADPAGLAVAALVTCAAAIPDQVQIKVKRHDKWKESARLWAAMVGPPSAKKSPIISKATEPLCSLDINMMRAWQKRVQKYNALSPEKQKGKQRPPQTRLRIEDATIEATQQVLAGSPWGILLLQDELSGFFGAMDKYNAGKGAQADRAFWLRSFNGGQYAINRITRGATVIENVSVSMLGGIQPEPLIKIAGDAADDGLLQRLFPIMLRTASIGRDEPMPPINDRYENLISFLREISPPGILKTDFLEFDDGAQVIRRNLEAKHLELQSLETINRKLASHIGKYDGLFARLCVVWHCVEHSECADPVDSHRELPATVTEGTAQRVADFLHRFLLPHALAFYSGVLGLSDDHDRLASIAGYILAHKPDRITNRDVQRGDRKMRGLKEYETRPLMEQLAALGWLNRVDALRPSSPPHWYVNPAVHEKFADRAVREAERREATRSMISKLSRK
jgi:hypothetical protein